MSRDGPTDASRAPHDYGARIAAVVLAAGRSTRMGGRNKLLEPVDGEPMIRRVVRATLASRAAPVVVVTGHEAERVREALAGLAIEIVYNAAHGEGLGASVRAGVGALPGVVDGALFCLGDMPWVTAADLDRLIDAFAPAPGRDLCVPVCDGRRGNPVLWGRRYFGELLSLGGDRGARALLERHAAAIRAVPAGEGVLRDVDEPHALPAAG